MFTPTKTYLKLGGILLIIALAILAILFRYRERNAPYYKPNIETTTSSSKIEGVDIKSLLIWDKEVEGNALYPVVQDSKNINKTIDKYVKNEWNMFLTDVENYKETHNASEKTKFEINITTELSYTTKDLVSFTLLRYRSIKNKKKEKNTVKAFNFDRKNDKQIYLSDVFVKDSGYLENLSYLAKKDLFTKIKEMNLDTTDYDFYKSEIDKRTKPDVNNFENFTFLEDEEIGVHYELGIVAPLDYGNIQATINLREIDSSKFNLDTIKIVYPSFYEEMKENTEQSPPVTDNSPTPEYNLPTPIPPQFRNVDCNRNKCIAFTFDDGPHATYTPAVLDEFDKHGGKATFYVLGDRAEYYPSILQRMNNSGFEIGNHTWSHRDLTGLTETQIVDEIQKTQNIVLKVTGTSPLTVRPPYGTYNDFVQKNAGSPLVLWSIDTRDWENPGPDIIIERVLSQASPGSIVLMHDIHSGAVQALPYTLDTLQDDGYVFVTVTEMIGEKPPGTLVTKR